MSDLYSSNFNLLMLNVWIGMCKGTKGLPRHLRDLGYQDYWIEYRFTNQDGDAVVPELIVASEKLNHTVLLEWKSGPNLDDDQLKRYLRIVSTDLTTNAFLKNSLCLNFDVCIVGKDEHKDRLKLGLNKGSYYFPLIACSLSEMALAKNVFKKKELTATFEPELKIDLATAPISFVPFSEESEIWEVAEAIIPFVISLMMKREASFTLDSVCSGVLPVWSIIATEKKNQIRGKVKEVLVEASKNEFRKHFGRNKGLESRTHEPTWDIKRNPLDLSTTKRSREFRSLQKQQASFTEALRTGKREAAQGDLFESE